jgi:glycosyltransferase involved in cell wall biosynthesis
MKILLVNQCFYPDVVSTAQHLGDLAVELTRRGHNVTVIAGSRGYDDPDKRFAKHEVWKGVTIHRIPSTGLGKRARWRRAIDFGSFIVSCAVRMILMPRVDLVVAMTSPPLISFLVAVLARVKGWRFAFWIMDLNPDEAVAAGWLRERSKTARVFAAMLLYSLKRAERVIVLDRFVRQRIVDKGVAEEKLSIIPPWSQDDAIRYDYLARERFRADHNLSQKYVVMYSGNHSPCHPLDTLLEAARRVSSHSQIVFCFVGGGSELEKVKTFGARHDLKNVFILPYQPMSELAGSLSAADLHVVVMGDPFVGIVHPCKIYNILSVGAPVLYIGPRESHVTDIFSRMRDGETACMAMHGDVDSVVAYIIEGASQSSSELKRGVPGPTVLAFSRHTVVPRLIAALEKICDSPARYDSAIVDSEARSL